MYLKEPQNFEKKPQAGMTSNKVAKTRRTVYSVQRDSDNWEVSRPSSAETSSETCYFQRPEHRQGLGSQLKRSRVAVCGDCPTTSKSLDTVQVQLRPMDLDWISIEQTLQAQLGVCLK